MSVYKVKRKGLRLRVKKAEVSKCLASKGWFRAKAQGKGVWVHVLRKKGEG